MAPKPLTAQDLLNLAGVFAGTLGGQFRKLAGQSGVLPPARQAAREGIEGVRGIFNAAPAAAKPAAAARYAMEGSPVPTVRRPEPSVMGVFQAPSTPAVRVQQPPVAAPTISQGSMQGPVRAVLPELDAPGTTYKQTSIFSPADNPAVRSFYETGGQPKAFAYKKAEGFDAASQLVRESDEIPSLVYGPRPDGAPGQLPLNLRTDITSAWSPKGAELRNLMANLQGRLPLLVGLGTAGATAAGITAFNLAGGGEETPLGPTTAKPPGSLEEQTAPNNVDATIGAAQTEAARAAAADVAAGGLAAQTQRFSERDSNLRQAAQAAAASARLDPSRTGGVQTAPTKGSVGAPADYKKIAEYYAARRQEATKPKSVDQSILDLQARGALDQPGIAQWAASNPVLAYELSQKLRARDISQQPKNVIGAEITSSLGSNVQNLVPGSTQGLIDAAEGKDPAIKDVTNAAVSTSIAPMPRDMQAFFNRVGFQNRVY